MLTVSNALLMSSDYMLLSVLVVCFCLNHDVMVLLMWCSAVFVEWLLFNPCCVEYCLLAILHVLLFNAMLYMLVRYASPNGLMCLKCLLDLCCGECYCVIEGWL